MKENADLRKRIWKREFGQKHSAIDIFGSKVTRNGTWQLDHIIPLNKGGSNNLSNIQILSKANNAAKSDKTRGIINNASFLVHLKSRDASGHLIGKMKVKK